ncbi:MAG: type III pantothenate kinase [Candidatus Thiodiazotropha sp. L084R]
MKLFVDIGNTAIKWASEKDLHSHIIHRASSHALPEAIDLPWSEMPEPDTVHIASVRQQNIVNNLTSWISLNWRANVRISETMHQELGVKNGYTIPSQLGVDRWLALLAARRISSRPVIVVDLGSATTIDGLDGEGRHLGGIIIPGLQLYAKCLDLNTDLSIDNSNLNLNDFATDTATGVQSGAMLSHLCMVERSLLRLMELFGGSAECILTGGNAHQLSEYLTIAHQVVPDLVIQGLALQSTQAN